MILFDEFREHGYYLTTLSFCTYSYRNYFEMSPSTFQRRTATMNGKGSALNQSQKVKTFCKVCYDTGKTADLYNNHFVRESRDPNSRILCPTLLALECRYCFVRGHTVSKCPKLAHQSGVCCDVPVKVQNRTSRCTDDDQSSGSNGFSLLYSSDNECSDDGSNDGSDRDTMTECITEYSSVFPCLNKSNMASVNEVSNKTYAAALMAVLKPVVVMDLADDISCVSSVSRVSTFAATAASVSSASYACPGHSNPRLPGLSTTCGALIEACPSWSTKHDVSSDEDVKVDLRKIFGSNKKYSVPGSWADSDSDDE